MSVDIMNHLSIQRYLLDMKHNSSSFRWHLVLKELFSHVLQV